MAREPLYISVSQQLRRALAEGHAVGEVLAGEHELARQYQVSLGTMRQALTALVQEGLLERRQGIGTTVRALPQGAYVAIYTEQDVYEAGISLWHIRLMGYVGEELERRGVAYRLFAGRQRLASARLDDEARPPTCREFLEEIERDRIGGVICVSTDPHPQWVEVLGQRGVPMVGTSWGFARRICFDLEDEFGWAVDQLVEMGRRRIGLMCWSNRHFHIDPFCRALQRRGLKVHEQWIRRDLFPALPGAGWEAFREIWSSSQVKPDGLIVSDDCLLPETDSVIRELKIKVPQRLALVGFTNQGIHQRCTLPMARVERDPRACAKALAGLFFEAQAGKRSPRAILMPSRRIAQQDVRETVESQR